MSTGHQDITGCLKAEQGGEAVGQISPHALNA